jgi:hypothetical protein
MATNYKVIAQRANTSTNLEDLYTVPASTQVIVSTLVVANRTTSARSFRIAVRPAGASIANQHYLAFDVPIGANDSTTLTLGITMEATDVISVRSSSANDLSFNLFGTLITP